MHNGSRRTPPAPSPPQVGADVALDGRVDPQGGIAPSRCGEAPGVPEPEVDAPGDGERRGDRERDGRCPPQQPQNGDRRPKQHTERTSTHPFV